MYMCIYIYIYIYSPRVQPNDSALAYVTYTLLLILCFLCARASPYRMRTDVLTHSTGRLSPGEPRLCSRIFYVYSVVEFVVPLCSCAAPMECVLTF